MEISRLSEKDKYAIIRSVNYWIDHWDWECPTIFGSSLEDFSYLSDSWPQSIRGMSSSADMIITGSLRELLYGASSLRPEEVEGILGINFTEAKKLLSTLMGESGSEKDA